MRIKWRLIGLFFVMTSLSLMLFWVGSSALLGAKMLPLEIPIVILSIIMPGSVVYFYAHTLSKRLERVAQTARKLTKGKLERFEFEESSDELGQLSLEINRLAQKIETNLQKANQDTQKNQAILRGMLEGVIALDHVGRIVLVNRAAEIIFKREQADVVGKLLVEINSDPALTDLVTKVLAGGPPGTIEITIGKSVVLNRVSPIVADNGRPRGVVIVSDDVTELRHLERIRTEFVGNVSHELRTPLTSIKGFVETLLDGAAEEPSLRNKFLSIIQSETLRLQNLIEELLALSRLENKEHRPENIRLSYIQKAFEDIRPVIEPWAEAKGIRLSINIPEELPAVKVGTDLLSQILLNLLENAFKYTTEGIVWLKGMAKEDIVILEFGDTGCGIPEESLPRIFERFYRVDKARSREQGGTGLGLSIVKHIIEGSGGKISVKSKVGVGTVFTCELPRVSNSGGPVDEKEKRKI